MCYALSGSRQTIAHAQNCPGCVFFNQDWAFSLLKSAVTPHLRILKSRPTYPSSAAWCRDLANAVNPVLSDHHMYIKHSHVIVFQTAGCLKQCKSDVYIGLPLKYDLYATIIHCRI